MLNMLRIAIAAALISAAVGQSGSGTPTEPEPLPEPTITTEDGVIKLSGQDVGFDLPAGMVTAQGLWESVDRAHDDNIALSEEVDNVMSELTAGLSTASDARQTLSEDIVTVTSSLGDLASTIDASVNSQLTALNENIGSVGAAIVGMSPLSPGNSCVQVFESLTAARVNLADPLGMVYIRNAQGAVTLTDCSCSCAPGLSCTVANGSQTVRIGRTCAELTFHPTGNNQHLIYNPTSGIPEIVTCPAPHADSRRAYTAPSSTNYVNKWAKVVTTSVPQNGQRISVDCRTNSGGSYSQTLTSCFRVGDVVVVHQTQHPNPELAGRYEYSTVASIARRSLSLSGPLLNTYSGGKIQVIRASMATRFTLPRGRQVRSWNWDGSSGGVIAVYANDISIAGTVNADCVGFRGGARDTGGCCRTHIRPGWPGESYSGPGTRVETGSSLLKHPSSGGVCSGFLNLPSGQQRDASVAYKRGIANGGGGGGGAGACHGGGGGGGSYGDDGWTLCYPSRHHWSNGYSCQSGGKPGEGQPECDRAGQWAQRGNAFGDSSMLYKQISLGSGGGGGNSYSPSSGQNNAGGRGGGAIILKAINSITVTSTGSVQSNGCGGYPVYGSGAFNNWNRVNTQDGSGGAGSGGGIIFSAGGTVNVNTNKVLAKGGPCSAYSGWRSWYKMQRGGSGGNGRVQAVAPNVVGTAPVLETSRHC